MLIRLWWKEARQFWPIWAFLALTALVVQWVVLYSLGRDAQTGVLGLFALGWAALYGCAAGAAAIAGEKEARTMAFLDAQGVGRGLFWSGKASFAIGSTLILAVVLIGIAALGTERWQTGEATLLLLAAGFAAVLLEVVGWSLLASAASSNPLIAALLSIGCLTVCEIGFSIVPDFVRHGESAYDVFVAPALWRLAVAAAATFASYTLVVVSQPGGRRRRASVITITGLDVRSPRRIARWRPAVRALVWQTLREVAPIWWKLAAVYFGVAVGIMLLDSPKNVYGAAVIMSWPVGVIAGTSIFGLDNRARTFRFLTHHGARPGTVWMVKAVVWGCAFAVLWLPVATLFELTNIKMKATGPAILSDPMTTSVTVVAAFLWTMSVGMLCGMVARRGITAAVVAAFLLFIMAVPLTMLVRDARMIPAWGLGVVPFAFLFVSWAWSADWMDDRPGIGRWIRLALYSLSASAVVFAGYVTYRITSVPRINNSILTALSKPGSLTGDNADRFYFQAFQKLNPHYSPDRLVAKAEALTLTRRGAALPHYWFPEREWSILFERTSISHYRPLNDLMFMSAHDRLQKGDLAGSWDDLLTVFRMARHFSRDMPLVLARQGLSEERRALGLALEWAADASQTPAQLRSALKDFQALPAMPSMAEITAVEAAIMQRTLRMPPQSLADKLVASSAESGLFATGTSRFWADMATTSWELVRARRAFHLLFSAFAARAALEPAARPLPAVEAGGWTPFVEPIPGRPGASWCVATGEDLYWVQMSTSLVRRLFPNLDGDQDYCDRNEVMRRALVQILALRRWQLRHGGRLPNDLLFLVAQEENDGPADHSDGVELASLPLDPYTGHHFKWIPSQGQAVPPLGFVGKMKQMPSTEGCRLLYSLGPNRVDNGAWSIDRGNHSNSEMVFPLKDKPGAIPKPPVPEFPAGMMGGAAGGIGPLPDQPPPD